MPNANMWNLWNGGEIKRRQWIPGSSIPPPLKILDARLTATKAILIHYKITRSQIHAWASAVMPIANTGQWN